jgi:hypothetical protein
MADLLPMVAKLLYNVRRLNPSNFQSDGDSQAPSINGRGDVCMVQGLPERADLVIKGGSYVSRATTGTAPVAAYPTTAAHFSLWNGESAGGKSYIIDEVGTVCTTSAGAVIILGLAYCNNKVSGAGITSPAGSVAISGLSGQANYGGKGNTKEGVTITNDGWFNVGQPIVCAGTATIGLGIFADVFGLIIVPPGGLFSLATICSAAGAAVCQPYIKWHEVQL